MKTILSMMTLSETREYGRLRHELYEQITPILQKPFIDVTVSDLFSLANTSIFDVSFTDLLFNDLWKRFTTPAEKLKDTIQ